MVMKVFQKILVCIYLLFPFLFVNATEKTETFHIIGPTDAVCVGQKIKLEASGPANGFEYFWYPRNKVVSPFLKATDYIPEETTQLFVVRMSTSNLSNTDTAYITVKVNEKEVEIYGPGFVCLGASASLEIAPYFNNPVWSTNENKHQIEVTKPGIYSVKAHEGCDLVKGNHYVDSKTNPLSRIMANRNTDLCNGDQVELRSFSAVNPSWSNGSESRSVIVKTSGNYVLRNTNECGIDKAEISVRVHPIQADFIPSATELLESENLELYNHSKHAVRYEWYQDGHLLSEEENTEVRFQTSGAYSVELHAFNAYGCRDIMEYPSIVVVSKESSISANKEDIIFPNSFTPNGDGKNDVFEMYTGDIYNLNVTIYNRWGQIIFEEQNSSEVVWNGTDIAGNKLEQGQYVVHYSYENKFGEPITKTSSVNLLR
ncbi:MAG: hypothetical protein CL842_08200 [Crocinitomicaceae bacterium]|nr:hypothetical protein [Crocinitomicaceae bacterium]|tara:strand:+ start:67888 stop:69174 length:1287 start_codon:yes stop_codon:yes gene_type:complete